MARVARFSWNVYAKAPFKHPGASVRTVRHRIWRERLEKLTARDVSRCPRCGGPLVTVVAPTGRDPPARAA